MLSKHSIRLAQTIAKQSNVSLEAEYNLFTNAILYSTPVGAPRANVSLESIGADVQNTAEVLVASETMSQHEEAVNNAVDVLLTGITNQFDYVRNTVRPFISTATDRLLTRLKSSTPAAYSIREFAISDFLTSDVATRLFKEVPLSHYYKVADSNVCKETGQILQDIATNIPAIDEAISDIVASLGHQAVADIYAALFCNKRPDDNTAVTDMIRRLIVKDGTELRLGVYSIDEIDFLLLAYFIVEGYLDNPVDGTGLSYADYKTYVKQSMNNIGSTIARLLRQYALDVKEQILYLRRPRGRGLFMEDCLGEILVLKPIARLAFEKGLTAEHLIGGVLNPHHKIFRLPELLRYPAESLAVYQAIDRERQRQLRNTIMERINSSLQIVLTETLNELPYEAFPPDYDRNAVLGGIGRATDELRVYFNSWDSNEEVQIYDLMTSVVCKLVFPFTDARNILETMETIVQDEDIEPCEAAYYALIRYMTRWMVANYHIGVDE